jgi:hypothetical protein
MCLRTPPYSLPKLWGPSSIGNRPFLRAFLTRISDVPGLCEYQRPLWQFLAPQSLHSKIPFLATEFRTVPGPTDARKMSY